MGVTSAALSVEKPIGEVSFHDFPKSGFAAFHFDGGGRVHVSYSSDSNALEVIKDFCQALIGAAEAGEAANEKKEP